MLVPQVSACNSEAAARAAALSTAWRLVTPIVHGATARCRSRRCLCRQHRRWTSAAAARTAALPAARSPPTPWAPRSRTSRPMPAAPPASAPSVRFHVRQLACHDPAKHQQVTSGVGTKQLEFSKSTTTSFNLASATPCSSLYCGFWTRYYCLVQTLRKMARHLMPPYRPGLGDGR